MSEILIIEGIKTFFWLAIFSISIYVFRNEIKQLLQSLSGFKVAGATFELKDKKETIRSYILLAETLIDFLSRSNRIEELYKLMHPSQIEKLGSFALQYTKEVPKSDWNEQLLRNIALLLLRFSRSQQSVDLCEILLLNRPEDPDLINLKALALMTSRTAINVETAEEILSNLVSRFPEIEDYRFNLALTLSLLEKGDDAAKQMQKVIDDGYWRTDRNLLYDPLFHHVREHRKDLFTSLQDHLTDVMSNAGTRQA